MANSVLDRLVDKESEQWDAAAELTTVELYRLRLYRHIQRLPQLVAMQAPPHVLILEILLLQDAVEGAYPDATVSVMDQRMRVRAKERLGRCVYDLCEKIAVPDLRHFGYCAEHLKQAEVEMGQI